MNGKNRRAFMTLAASFILGAGACSHAKPKKEKEAAKPAATASTTTAARPIEAGEPVVRNDGMSAIAELAPVYFDFDRDLIKPEFGATLSKNADWLKAHPDVKIQVAGHCDQRGTVAYNLALGQRRAAAVRDYYEKLGVGGGRIATISYGKEAPVCEEPTDECWSKNRGAMSLKANPMDVSGVFASWPKLAKLAARTMIEIYGDPGATSSTELRWQAAGPWRKIVVHKDAVSPLEEAVSFTVPADKLPALEKFRHGVTVQADEGTLTARGDSEDVNRLALNLAHDIATGRMTPAEADRFFEKMMRLEQAGKTSDYVNMLLF